MHIYSTFSRAFLSAYVNTNFRWLIYFPFAFKMPVVKATLKRKRELISTVKAKKVEKRCSLQSDILVEASHFKNHEGKNG